METYEVEVPALVLAIKMVSAALPNFFFTKPTPNLGYNPSRARRRLRS